MQYQGGKHMLAKELGLIINNILPSHSSFVDLFCGACNVVCRVNPAYPRYANDINKAVVSTLEGAATGYVFPELVTKDQYAAARLMEDSNPLKAFILVGNSYAGKYDAGFVGHRENGTSYAATAKRGLEKKRPLLWGVTFSSLNYLDYQLPFNSLVYCDIPYHGVTGYRGASFDHSEFYGWVKNQKATVLISEYASSPNPLNLPTLWQKNSRTGLRGKEGKSKKTVEVLRLANNLGLVPSSAGVAPVR